MLKKDKCVIADDNVCLDKPNNRNNIVFNKFLGERQVLVGDGARDYYHHLPPECRSLGDSRQKPVVIYS